jgi:hypothetical protein
VDPHEVSSTFVHIHRPNRWGARIARIAGFGGLLAILAAEGFYSLKVAWQIQVSNTEMRRNFLSRERTLEQVRSALHESGNVVRDYVLVETGENKAETLRTELKTIRDDMQTALKVYSLSLRPKERGPFQQLATEVKTYWSTLDPSSIGTQEQGGTEAIGFFAMKCSRGEPRCWRLPAKLVA